MNTINLIPVMLNAHYLFFSLYIFMCRMQRKSFEVGVLSAETTSHSSMSLSALKGPVLFFPSLPAHFFFCTSNATVAEVRF